MEERQPIKMEEIPEEEKPKRNIIYKIALGCLFVVFVCIKCGIRNPQAIAPMKSVWYMQKAMRASQQSKDRTESTYRGEVAPSLDKALSLDSTLWSAWLLKGAWMSDLHHLDSACFCFEKAVAHMDESATPEQQAKCIFFYADCLRITRQLDNALNVAKKGTKQFPDNKEIREELKQCIRQQCDTILSYAPPTYESPDPRPWQITDFAESMRQDSLWSEAIYIAKRGLKVFPEHPEIKREMKNIYIPYADYLLANSDDTQTLWKVSQAIWKVDRKRALNLRRKCARLGDKDAQAWFKQKGYEWD